MPAGIQTHDTPSANSPYKTVYSTFNSPSLDNSPSTLPTGYAGSYSAADLKTWPTGGILTTGTLEDLRKGTNQLAKDFNTAIVSHQSQITTNDGHLDKINVNLNEIKTDSIEIARDLSNKAWDTITIVAGTGLVDTHGTADTADDISGSPAGRNLKSDIQIDLKIAASGEIGGVLSSDTAITESAAEGTVAGHITVNSSTGAMKLLNNAVQLGTHTRGSYVKLMGAAGNTGKGGTIKNIVFTGQGNSPSGGSGFQSAEVTLDLSDTGVGTTFDGTLLGSTTSAGGITTVTVPSFKVDKKGRITEANNSITGDFATNQNITITAGTKLSGGGTITSNAGTSQTLTINHEASTLSAGVKSVGTTVTHDTSGDAQDINGKFGAHHRQVNILDSIETDAQGHIVAIATRPITYGLDSPKGGVGGLKYTSGQDFDLHVPTEKDFQSLQLQVNNLETATVTIPETGPVTISRNVTLNNDLSVADDLVIDTDTLVVDSANDQVGIGTTSPGKKLDVVGTGRFSGALELGGGLYVNDQIIHTGDTDTSIRFPADDIFTIETAGSERFRINTVGSVGIGVTSPGALLHVKGTESSGTIKALIENGGTGQSGLDIKNSDGHFRIITDDGAFRVYDQTDNNNRITIDTDGNVGIGTSSPGFKLSLHDERTTGTNLDAFKIGYQSGGGFAIGLVDASEGNPDHRIRTHGLESIRFAQAYGDYVIFDGANQRVGIGDMTPSYKLDVDGEVRAQHTLRAAQNLIVGTTIQAASGNFDVDSSGNISDVSNIVSGGDISATGTISADTFLGVGTSTADSNDSIDGRTYGPYKFQVEGGDSKFAGNVNVTGNLNVTGISSTGSTQQVDFNTSSLNAVGDISMSGTLSSTNTTQSTNVNSGSLILDGGAGIAKNVFIGGTLNATGATTLGTLSAGGGGFDIDSSGNITDVGSIAAGGKIIINGVSGTIAQTTATNGHLQIINGSDNLAFDSNEIFATNSLNIGVADGKDIFFLEGNDAHLTIKDGGNVGIGISGPTEELHVYGNSNSAPITALIQNQGTHQATLKLKNFEGQFALLTDGSVFKIHDDIEGATRLTINSSGDVGIGTTSPDSKLEVAGNIKSTGRITGTSVRAAQGAPNNQDGSTVGFSFGDDGDTGMFSIGTGGAAGGDIAFFSNNSRTVTIESGTGNVGIGVTDPDEKLEVNGKVKISNTSTIFNTGPANAPLRVGSDTGFIGIDSNEIETLGSDLTLRVPHNKVFTFQSRVDTDTSGTYANTLMQVLANGRVGIGTTAPTDKLHVAGTSAFDSHLHVGASTGGIALTLNDGYGNANVAFNHALGKPSVNGSSGRIEVGVDASTGYMNLEVGDNSTAGVTKVLTPQITIKSDSVENFFQTSIHSNLTIKSNATHLKFNAASSDTELANILMDNSSGLEISVTSSNANAKRIRMRPGNAETWVFGVNASTTSEKIICNDTTAGSQNDGAIHTNGGISANSDLYIGGGTPTMFADVSKGCTVFGGTSASDDTRVRIRAAGSGVAKAIQLDNADSGGTACAINSLRGLVLSADTDNNSGESESFISMQTDGDEVFRIQGNGVSYFNGAVRNVTKTVTASGSDVTLDLRETNVFIINVTANTIVRANNEGSCNGAAFTFIFKNQGNFDINFGGEFYFTGGDPLLTQGGSTSSPKIDLVSGVCDGTNIYCAINYDLQSS